MSSSTDVAQNESDRTYWEPPDGYDWGEGTRQALAQRGEDPDERPEWHTDAREIQLAAALFNQVPAPFEYVDDLKHELYNDTLIHEKPAERTESAGGTDWLQIGKRGCGKTTNNRSWAQRLMEVNGPRGEKVVWRGSPDRSGWVAFREWTTLWLPEHASIEATWQSEHAGVAPEPVDLEDVVRQVRYYDDPVDLLDRLADEPGGTFHVVYPDPSFTGLQALTRATDRVPETLPFTPAWATIGEESATPLVHWWYAFFLAAVDFREADYWLSVIFDEAGDLTPQYAKEDQHMTYSKLVLIRSLYADSRKFRVSLYWSAHYEENLHDILRREVERRIDMPDGSPNPVERRSKTHPVGFRTVPMRSSELVGRDPSGGALMFNESRFTPYTWKDITRRDGDDRWLKLSMGEPEWDDDEASDEPELVYDRSVFKRWTAGDEDRLYVRDPGSGYIDVMTGAEVEPLESPVEDWEFDGIREAGGERLVSMLSQGSDEQTVVARLPIREFGVEVEA